MEDTQARGRTWTTDQLQEEFDVLWFSAPYVAVVRKPEGGYAPVPAQPAPLLCLQGELNLKPGVS